MNTSEFIRPAELAKMLSVSISTVYRMTPELPPKIKLSKNGSAVGWLRSDIMAFLNSRKIEQ
ncbi:MAG: AlpA family phage regulatory protein [Bacteroidetes bacterium]|nr:AlpA family phage regulatory protein [Bacteroidota bacterium]